MAVGTYSLITLAELQNFSGIPASPTAAQTATLEALIDGTSDAFEKYIQNGLINRAYTEDYSWEELSRHWTSQGPHRIELRRYPIVSVTSITDQASTPNTIAATEYWLDKPHGWLVRNGVWQRPVDANGWETYWTIVYTAGRFASTATVDTGIKLAMKMQVAHAFANPNSIKKHEVDDLQIEYHALTAEAAVLPLLPSVRALLSTYVRRVV